MVMENAQDFAFQNILVCSLQGQFQHYIRVFPWIRRIQLTVILKTV